LAALPDGYSIAIYTLQRSAAERAIEVLKQRYPGIRARGYYDTHPNEPMRSAARSADQVVIVSSCIKHAVSIPISSLAGDRLVYASSRGTDSILRAIAQTVAHAPHVDA
jgi:hypothetical protein